MKKFIILLLIFSVSSAYSQETNTDKSAVAYSKGLHYTEIDPAFETDNETQVVIYEFFGYKCPHCSNFQPFIKPWQEKLPKHIKLVRVPVVFQPNWDIFAKAYYTAETMGIIEKTHQPLFDALHKERKRFTSIEGIAAWFEDNFSVDKDAFISTANSFMIDSRVRQSGKMLRLMKIKSTPTLIINGKYTPDVKALGSIPALLDMATILADKEAKLMGLTQ